MPIRVLLDECLPRKLKIYLAEHFVSTVQENGWSGMKNGALMALAENKFDAFVTVDQNLIFQQNLSYSTIATLLLLCRTPALIA